MDELTLHNALKLIFDGIKLLKEAHPKRKFTIDGRLVGDIGEVIAGRDYQIELDGVSLPAHDGKCEVTTKLVQIKATFKDSLTFKKVPDLYLGLKLYDDGKYDEVFNGPGQIIADEYSHRKGIGETQLSFPIKRLKELSGDVPIGHKLRERNV